MSWWGGQKQTYGGVEFWHSPERCGWLHKQGAPRRSPSRLVSLSCAVRL